MTEKSAKKVLMMGNEAIARGAVEAGITVATSYPGTPASEIMEKLAQWSEIYGFHAEWSVNEKVALETAAGASFAGARAITSMKQMGLNVASDALMSLAYIGVKGGLVIVVADDPGPHSSQTEQDTRRYASFAKLPVLDPSSPQEAKNMTVFAFELSEKLRLPIIVRTTTRSSHAFGDLVLGEIYSPTNEYKFEKDPGWCILPGLASRKHIWLEEQQEEAKKIFASSPFNRVEKSENSWGIIASGVSYNYAREALQILNIKVPLLKIGTPCPLPGEPTIEFLRSIREVLVVEEQEPVIEDQIIRMAWNKKLPLKIHGKHTGDVSPFGEFDIERVIDFIRRFRGQEAFTVPKANKQQLPQLPNRPPVLCAGCGHRGAFYAFKKAGEKYDAVYCGDIGCYTLGYAEPLNATDTCLCMGAGITIAYGLSLVEKERPHIAFIGDSTFLHAGMTGLLNLVHNRAGVVLVVLDNETTAMTGHQPHPGTGKTAAGAPAGKVDIEKIVRGLGVEHVEVVNPLDFQAMLDAAEKAMHYKGPSVIIARAPCAIRTPKTSAYSIDKELCTECELCITELGCPGIIKLNGVEINDSCNGCGLCRTICPSEAIKEVYP